MRTIRNSAKALIIRDGKLLCIRVRDGGEEWHILPGGGQEPGETLAQAVRREVAEELGLDVEPAELVFAVEGPQGEAFHRVDLVFLCKNPRPIPHARLHGDTNQTGVDWLDIATLNRSTLYPSRLRRPIMNLVEGRPHPVYLGSESIGDPEMTN